MIRDLDPAEGSRVDGDLAQDAAERLQVCASPETGTSQAERSVDVIQRRTAVIGRPDDLRVDVQEERAVDGAGPDQVVPLAHYGAACGGGPRHGSTIKGVEDEAGARNKAELIGRGCRAGSVALIDEELGGACA